MSIEAVNGWQTGGPVPQSPRAEKITWGIAIAAVALLVIGFAAHAWSRHQQLAPTASSVPATMELDGAMRIDTVKHYRPVGYAPDARARLTVTYRVSDQVRAYEDLISTLYVDGWTAMSGQASVYDGSATTYVKPGSEIESVDVYIEGDLFVVTVTPVQ